MRLLVLGGSGFVGGAVVAEALAAGWDVTTFNRGLHGTVPDGVTQLRGDRRPDGDLSALARGEWDAVVDTWDGNPAAVGATVELLRGRIGHYGYVSSRSVYRGPLDPGAAEDAPLYDASDDPDFYPGLKVGGEEAVRDVYGEDALIARAGLILGPGEDVGRLPWWLRRMRAGGDVLAPGPRDLPLQYVDARDLAIWMLTCAREKRGGSYNSVSLRGHMTMERFLVACRDTVNSGAVLRWTDPEPILAAGVVPWNDLPVWIPEGHEFRWLHTSDTARAAANGLRCRPIEETVADTWAWLEPLDALPDRAGKARRAVGLDPKVERAILRGEPD